MTVYLVRHAVAMSRRAWKQRRRRSPSAHRQGRAPGGRARRAAPRRPTSGGCCRARRVRCVDTVRPLAKKLGLEVGVDGRVAGGRAGREGLRAAARRSAGKKGDSVLCAHGDLIPALVEAPRPDGHEDRARCGGRRARSGSSSGTVTASLRRGTYRPADVIVTSARPGARRPCRRRCPRAPGAARSSSTATTDIANHASDPATRKRAAPAPPPSM